MKLEGLSLFFPCHNEEANVDGVIRDALQIAPVVASRYEILIIDDGSTDRTPEIVRRLSAAGLPLRLVRHEHRQGYGAALKSGFLAAKEPWVFFSDGDRQFNLSELPRLVELRPQADIVSGYRLHRADPWYRILNAWVYRWALRWLIGLDIRDVNCAFKLCRSSLFDHLQLKCSGALINAEIFAKAKKRGATMAFVGVTHKPRASGRPTGAQLKVILKAMKEFWSLWEEIRHGAT